MYNYGTHITLPRVLYCTLKENPALTFTQRPLSILSEGERVIALTTIHIFDNEICWQALAIDLPKLGFVSTWLDA